MNVTYALMVRDAAGRGWNRGELNDWIRSQQPPTTTRRRPTARSVQLDADSAEAEDSFFGSFDVTVDDMVEA